MPRLVSVEKLFKGRHFDQEIVVLCVRGYQSYKFSYGNLVAMVDERGIGIAHTTVLGWVHYSREFEKLEPVRQGHWRLLAQKMKHKGEWMYRCILRELSTKLERPSTFI